MSNTNTNAVTKSTRFRPKKTRAKPIEPKLLRVSCPDCGGAMRTIFSKQTTPAVQDRHMTCTNDECLAVYKVQVSAYLQITPPMPARLATIDSADSADSE